MSSSRAVDRHRSESKPASAPSAPRDSFVIHVALLFFSAIFAYGGFNQLRAAPSHVTRAEEAGVPVTTGIVQVTGGTMLLCLLALQFPGLRRAAATLLALQLPVITYIGHRFWAQPTPPQRAAQLTQFLKNVSLFGASLYIAATSK
ncbi:MAG TPA: hypothetical protein VFZ25_16260 [Chloroflexota bacterium]|nr:hypothetical protein [Chloroflexota bacterium]